MILYSISDEFTKTFTKASIILPVINETHSLTKTVEIIEASSEKSVQEYLIVVCERTEKKSLELASDLQKQNPERFFVIWQNLPFLGGAVRDAFDKVSASHCVMMASDLETDPNDVKTLIDLAKKYPQDIITASRWLKGGEFAGYDKNKLVLNYIFQKFFSFVFSTSLTDMTYGFRIFPSWLVKNISWDELKHPFLFETLVKPLRLGVKVHEIPSKWKARVEGESQNSFFRNFEYFRTGFGARFKSREKILKSSF